MNNNIKFNYLTSIVCLAVGTAMGTNPTLDRHPLEVLGYGLMDQNSASAKPEQTWTSWAIESASDVVISVANYFGCCLTRDKYSDEEKPELITVPGLSSTNQKSEEVLPTVAEQVGPALNDAPALSVNYAAEAVRALSAPMLLMIEDIKPDAGTLVETGSLSSTELGTETPEDHKSPAGSSQDSPATQRKGSIIPPRRGLTLDVAACAKVKTLERIAKYQKAIDGKQSSFHD